MDKHPTQISIAIGVLCLIQLMIGCGNKDEQPKKAVAVSKKIVAKSNAAPAPVQAPVMEAEKQQAVSSKQPAASAPVQASVVEAEKQQVVSSKQPAAPVPGKTLTAEKAKPDSAEKADAQKTGAPSPAEQIALVAQKEITVMQPEGVVGYNPEGKIDPFVPLFKEGVASGPEKQGKERRIPRTPLEMVDIGQLKLVAIMHARSGNKALVEEASGKGYVVAKGSYMGMNSGKVVKILKDSIIIEEEAENIIGKRIIQERELKLQKPLGEE